MDEPVGYERRSRFPSRFFLMTYAISWVLWIAAALTGKSSLEWPAAPLFLLGGFGPSIAAVIMMTRATKDERRDFWRRTFDFARIRPVWFAIIFLLIPIITATSIGIDALLGGGPHVFPNAAVLLQPAALAGTLLIGILAGPLSEELGWRGYALDRLQARMAPLPAALFLGIIWWAWHLPLFFISGTTHATWGLFSIHSLYFLLTVFPLSVLISWAYNHNRRSILSAVLIHFMFNFIFGLVYPTPARVEFLRFVFLSLTVIWIILATRKNETTLS